MFRQSVVGEGGARHPIPPRRAAALAADAPQILHLRHAVVALAHAQVTFEAQAQAAPRRAGHRRPTEVL
jgi:hypothetical protein